VAPAFSNQSCLISPPGQKKLSLILFLR